VEDVAAVGAAEGSVVEAAVGAASAVLAVGIQAEAARRAIVNAQRPA